MRKRIGIRRFFLDAVVLGYVMFLNGMLCDAQEQKPVVNAATFIDKTATDCGLQKAIDSLGEKGGILEIPEGEYKLCRYLFLRSGVTLRGAGMDKTMLTVGNPPHYALITASDEKQTDMTLDNVEGLVPGMQMHIFSYGKETHGVHRSMPKVTAVEGNKVTMSDHKYQFIINQNPYVTWGNQLRLVADAKKGESVIQVDMPTICKPGYALTMSGPGDQWDFHYNVIKSIDGDKLNLERPLTVSAKSGGIIDLNFSMIVSENQKGIGIDNLTIRGFVTDTFAGPWTGFTVAGIHTHKTSDIVIRNVAVENWSGDGISIQSANNVLVSECVGTGNFGHGFHPGTGMTKARFEKLNSFKNFGDGFYYCWHNNGTDLYDSVLKDNRGNGIGGLGNPGDGNCTISGNTIEDNDQCGIQAYGGVASKNVIKDNLIRNNSCGKPGQYPGIALYAIPSESCMEVTIENNIIESTTTPATQKIGIEERHSQPNERAKPSADPVSGLILSDKNKIIGNKFSGHEIADIVVAGPNTVVGEDQGKVEKRLPQPAAEKT
jgi:parallel beta-helix repeat protein